MSLRTPYLLFLGDAPDMLAAKVALGIKQWRPENCVGQLRLPGCKADCGLPDMSIEQAIAAGAQTVVIGVANRGGVIAKSWIEVLTGALAAGMDVAAGLHNRLAAEPELVAAAQRYGRALHDVRVPTVQYPIATGEKRNGLRLLAVGTDCSCGKMYTTLALEAEMRARHRPATFRATGQTGILITGDGVPLDAVVADFMAGSIETLTPDNAPDHWDMVEGQGSMMHPSYSGVTMALIHGSQPDAMVVCHEPTRTHMRGLPHQPVPSIEAIMEVCLTLAHVVNPASRFVGVAVNTHALDEAAAMKCLEETEARIGLPTVDPVRTGVGRIVDALE